MLQLRCDELHTDESLTLSEDLLAMLRDALLGRNGNKTFHTLGGDLSLPSNSRIAMEVHVMMEVNRRRVVNDGEHVEEPENIPEELATIRTLQPPSDLGSASHAVDAALEPPVDGVLEPPSERTADPPVAAPDGSSHGRDAPEAALATDEGEEHSVEALRQARIEEVFTQALTWRMSGLRVGLRGLGIQFSAEQNVDKRSLAWLYANMTVDRELRDPSRPVDPDAVPAPLPAPLGDPLAGLPPLVPMSTEVSKDGVWVLAPSEDGSAAHLRCAMFQDGEIQVDRIPPLRFRKGTLLIPCSRTGTKAFLYEPEQDAPPRLCAGVSSSSRRLEAP
jgi:hypothetical protein